MDVDRATEELTERKVVRRGLLTGIAALGAAAVMHVKGAGKAGAADPDDLVLNVITNAATAETRLTASPATGGPALQVLQGATAVSFHSCITAVMGASASSAIHARNTFAGGTAIVGVATGGSGVNVGVHGRAAASGSGVLGSTGGETGDATAAGVEGQSAVVGVPGVKGLAINGTGVKGTSSLETTGDGDGAGIGVHGKSTGGNGVQGESVNAAGVFGKSTSQPGVHGESIHSLGVRGISTNFTAMVGISTNGHGLYGSTSHAASAGFVGENLGGGLAGYFAGNVFVTGTLQVVGAKNAVLKMQDGTMASVYCQESPEPYFEDFGRAQLVGGVANVALEREFAQLVAGGDYMVFLTPQGPSQGLYVSRQGPSGFEVRDSGNGSIGFTYRIVTKRKDVEGKRFARVVDSVGPNLAASRVAMGITGAPPVNNAPPSQQTPPFVPPPNAPSPNPTQPSPAPAPPTQQLPGLLPPNQPPGTTGR